MITGNRTDQFGQKPKAPSLRTWLLPPLLGCNGWDVRSQVRSQDKSELAEAAWDSSSVSMPWLSSLGL